MWNIRLTLCGVIAENWESQILSVAFKWSVNPSLTGGISDPKPHHYVSDIQNTNCTYCALAGKNICHYSNVRKWLNGSPRVIFTVIPYMTTAFDISLRLMNMKHVASLYTQRPLHRHVSHENINITACRHLVIVRTWASITQLIWN